MVRLPKTIENLIDEFAKLPGVGSKTAARLTFYLLNRPENEIKRFGESVSGLKTGLTYCSECYNIAETDPCVICQDDKRDDSLICVVEEPLDIIALSKTDYFGKFHVLGGVISPIDGIGPDQLKIEQLLKRLQSEDIKEVIMATDPSLEGEATANYIVDEIEKMKKNGKINKKITISRIARGLPVGGDLEYADEVTLARAIEGRRKFNN